MSRIGYETQQNFSFSANMNGDSQDDDSDRDHAQEGQEPVGQSTKSLVTRGRQKNVDKSPIAPLFSGGDKTSVESLGGDFSINNAFNPRNLGAK